jgi:hypothetical protein
VYKEYCKLQSAKGGQGVFTTVVIPAGAPIMEVRGPVGSESEMPDPNHPAILQVGPNIFIGPSGDLDDYINHSCNPNCFMHIAGSRAILFSMYVIPVGTELTFDYSSTSTDPLDKWKMDCICGDFNCRKVISGYQHLDDTVKQHMKNKRMLPLYILEPTMFPERLR